MKWFAVMLAAVSALAAADVVITSSEVIRCDVLNGDSSYVRLKLPSGGLRVLKTQDVYEIKSADQDKVNSLSTYLPGTRVTYDAQADFFAAEEAAKRDSATAVDRGRDAVGARRVMLAGGLAYTGYDAAGVAMSTLAVSPSLVLFVARGIGLGVDVSINAVAVGNSRATASAFGPKVTAALGPRGSAGYFLAEAGISLLNDAYNDRGDRLWFGGGYLPVVGRNLGLPITLRVNMDHVGESRLTSVQISWGLCGLL